MCWSTAWTSATTSASRNMEKLFGCPVHASLPNDYFSLHRVVTLGQPLGAEGELGKAIEKRRRAAVRRPGRRQEAGSGGPGNEARAVACVKPCAVREDFKQ